MILVFVVIRLRDHIHVGILVVAIGGIPILYGQLITASHFMSNVHTLSIQFLSDLGHGRKEGGTAISREDGKNRKEKIDSVAPIKFYVSDLYFMDKGAKCVLADSLVAGSVSLLLTF